MKLFGTCLVVEASREERRRSALVVLLVEMTTAAIVGLGVDEFGGCRRDRNER